MLTDTPRWSHARDNEVVPSPWQATTDLPRLYLVRPARAAHPNWTVADGLPTPKSWRGDGPEPAEIGHVTAVDVTFSQRCSGHVHDRATAGTCPQPLSPRATHGDLPGHSAPTCA